MNDIRTAYLTYIKKNSTPREDHSHTTEVLMPKITRREVQAYQLFHKFGKILGYENFQSYLADVPEIPKWPETHARAFSENALVDTRVLHKVGLKEFCKIVGLHFYAQNEDFIPTHPFECASERIEWIRFQDGFRNAHLVISNYEKFFAPYEKGMDIVEGICVFIQNACVVNNQYTMGLPGSIKSGSPDEIASMGTFQNQPTLYAVHKRNGLLNVGLASKGE